MNNISTELATALVQGLSIDEIIRQELQTSINLLLKSELTEFLQYEAYDVSGYNSGNSRNGYYKRTLKTKYGEVNLDIPRDRNGDFEQQTIPSYKRRTDDLETTILQLYRTGITTSEIATLIEKMYGHAYSKGTISNISKTMQEHVDAFHKRQVNESYVVIFGDSTFLPLRRDTVAKEAVHILVGITAEGNKEIIDYRIFPTESSANYREMLVDLRERGCKEVLMFVTDGLTGIRDACLEVYPKALHQSCWVHVQRNIAKLVRQTDRQEIADLVKEIYTCNSKATAMIKRDEVCNKIAKRYQKVVDKLCDDNESLFSFYLFPPAIRSSVYTTNIIEGINKQLKRNTKKKEQFPNEDALDRVVYNYVMDFNGKSSTRLHGGFRESEEEIIKLFEETYGTSED